MSDRIYLGPPGLTLANGRPLEYGEELTLTADDEHANENLITAGHLPERTTPETLTGDALKQRAADLGIEGRTQMTADQLRAAIAEVAQSNSDEEQQS